MTAEDRSRQFQMMREGKLASVHSWELVTAVDGPGTRLSVFFAGCPLRCLYCHNPDTLKMKDGQLMETDTIIAKMKRYLKIFQATDGGLTLTGGEVLMQAPAAKTILKAAKELGIHTAIDTSGFLGAKCDTEMLETIDLALLDVKSGDPDTYRAVTGRSLEPTLHFGRVLSEHKIEIWLRFVLVPGLTDTQENIAKVATYAKTLSSVTRVEILPFHQMGASKWEKLGLEYKLENTSAPSQEKVKWAQEIFRQEGIETVY